MQTLHTRCCLTIHLMKMQILYQGCGLGLDVSVSRRIRVLSRFCLNKNRQRLGLGRLTSQSRSHTSRAQEQYSAKFCSSQFQRLGHTSRPANISSRNVNITSRLVRATSRSRLGKLTIQSCLGLGH